MSIMTILILLCSCGASALPVTASAYEAEGYTYETMDTLLKLIEEQQTKIEAAHELAEAARKLEYSEEHEIIQTARAEWKQADELKTKYENIYINLKNKWEEKEKEYPAATYIWTYLKDLGYNDQICAGILGNIMTECGGQTLDIQWYLESKSYYGICQWAKKYASLAAGASLKEQCDYLRDTIKDEIDTFGYCYQKNFSYNEFLQLTDIGQATLAFAKTYERCSSNGYKARQINAINAYNYFIS